MSNFKKYFSSLQILTALVMWSYLANAQYFVAGQEPASVRWRQIQTSNFQIIFPEDYENQAQRVAHVFEKAYEYSGVTLKHKAKKISVILHTKTLKTNGFVAWAPSRVELYTTPGQDLYAQEWIEQLAVHELRHHVQIDKIEQEMPAIFKVLLGEQAASLVVGAYLPFWFLEGDAVVTETALSQSGRGRLPSFTMELKAQADNKGVYSFDKAYLGSFKDYVPDYYQLGYQIIANVRNQYGGEVWSKVLHQIARSPLRIHALSRALRTQTGRNQDELYISIMNNLKNSGSFGFDSAKITDIDANRKKTNNNYTSYSFPFFINDSSYIALRTSIDHIPSIVRKDGQIPEKKLFSPGVIEDESMSYANGLVIWVEAKPDLRWTNRESSLVRILDINNGTLKEFNYSEKIQAPVISPDGNRIAAVKFNEQNLCSMVIFSRQTGIVQDEYRAKNTNIFLTPSWRTDQKSLYAVELGPEGKSLDCIDIQSGEVTQLTTAVFGVLKKPVQRANLLFFTADNLGKEEGYALDLTTKARYRVVSAQYGIKDLQLTEDGGTIICSDYTANGFKIRTERLSAQNRTFAEAQHHYRDTLSDKLSAQEGGVIDFNRLDSGRYKSEKYSKIKNLFNFHSWSPVYVNADQSTINSGFSFVSQNKLATAVTQLGYDYSTADHTGKWIGKFEYTGWFPALRLYGDYGRENSGYFQVNRKYNSSHVVISQDTVFVKYSRSVLNVHLDASIPLNFSHGKTYRMVIPEIQAGYSQYWKEASTPSTIFNGSYIPITYRIYAHNLLQQSLRDIQPSFGQIFEFQFRHTPFGDKQLGTIASAEGTFYFPGFVHHQGWKFYTGYQTKTFTGSGFGDLIYYPRGYRSLENKRLVTLRADYTIPLLCPDWQLWHLYYLKRVSVRFHYDFASILLPVHQSPLVIQKTLSSYGAELITECHFLRFIAPVKVGFRESYLTASKTFTSEFILSINLRGI